MNGYLLLVFFTVSIFRSQCLQFKREYCSLEDDVISGSEVMVRSITECAVFSQQQNVRSFCVSPLGGPVESSAQSDQSELEQPELDSDQPSQSVSRLRCRFIQSPGALPAVRDESCTSLEASVKVYVDARATPKVK